MTYTTYPGHKRTEFSGLTDATYRRDVAEGREPFAHAVCVEHGAPTIATDGTVSPCRYCPETRVMAIAGTIARVTVTSGSERNAALRAAALTSPPAALTRATVHASRVLRQLAADLEETQGHGYGS
jgi:hypothetical protein